MFPYFLVLKFKQAEPLKMMLKTQITSQPSYNVTEAFSNKPKQPIQWFNDTAYKLESMEDRRYEKVRRENIIVKQIGGGSFIAKAVGV